MSTDVSHPSIPTTVKTVVVPVGQEPIDTGVRLPVEQITLDELERRRQADAAQACAAVGGAAEQRGGVAGHDRRTA